MPESANHCFIARLGEFDRLMEKLAALRAANFGAVRDRPDWNDVGSLGFLVGRLHEATNHYANVKMED